jgi:hypothetical protein
MRQSSFLDAGSFLLRIPPWSMHSEGNLAEFNKALGIDPTDIDRQWIILRCALLISRYCTGWARISISPTQYVPVDSRGQHPL